MMAGRAKRDSNKKNKDSSKNRLACASTDENVSPSIGELYGTCVQLPSARIQWKAVQIAVVNLSAAETIVWPALIQKLNNQLQSRSDGAVSLDQICYLLAILTSWEYREGGSIDALQFVANDRNNENPWKLCCESIFSRRQISLHGFPDSESSTNAVWTIQTHFLTICWTASQVNRDGGNCKDEWFRAPLLRNVGGMDLWNFMPARYRELELRKLPISLQQRWSDMTTELHTKEKETIFIVDMIQHVLHLVEGESLKLGHDHFSQSSCITVKKRKRVDQIDNVEGSDDVEDEENMYPSSELDDGSSGSSDDIDLEDMDPLAEEARNEDGDRERQRMTQLASWSLVSAWRFVHRALELLIDLLSSSTGDVRQFLVPYLTSIHWNIRCQQAIGKSTYSTGEENLLLTQQLLERVAKWLHFPLRVQFDRSDETQEILIQMNSVELRSLHFRRASMVQKMCYRHFTEVLPDVIYAGVGLLCNASFLRQSFRVLKERDFADLLHRLRLIDSHYSGVETHNRKFLMDVLEEFLIIPQDLVEELRTFPLYPTERELWNFLRVPPSHSNLLPSNVLSLPKLQTRFLSFSDYLWRNFELVRLESAFEIRSDLTDAVRRLRPLVRQVTYDNQDPTSFQDPSAEIKLKTEFTGWARMAIEMSIPMEIKRVRKPLLGEQYPSSVQAEFTIDLAPCGEKIRREWDGLGEHDVLFVVTVDAKEMSGQLAPLISDYVREQGWRRQQRGNDTSGRRLSDEDDRSFPSRLGLLLVRGCKIVHVRDEAGTILSDSYRSAPIVGTKRVFLVELDPTQYSYDSKSSAGTDIYQSFNLVVRRQDKTNNFRSVLETIRSLLIGMGSIGRVIPTWLQSVLLGQGNLDNASYKSETIRRYAANTAGVANPDAFLDYFDTFIDETHLRSSFSSDNSVRVRVDGRDELMSLEGRDPRRCNYRVRIVRNKAGTPDLVDAVSYPFGKEVNGNSVRFTPLQVEAIRSGLSPGLTLVVGPPGTGKSDTAVQIISSLYHSFPTQRTVIIAHSNAALNDIFQKVMFRGDIEERYLVRLGAGERNLQTESTHDFTKVGRVAYSLERRKVLLDCVQLLAESLGLSTRAQRGKDGSSAYTCETAGFFYRYEVVKRIKLFYDELKSKGLLSDDEDVTDFFPFADDYGIGAENIALSKARRHIKTLEATFRELAEYRPFELLRSQRQRSDYLILKQARVVAMTCTHAAIARSHLIELGFEYDNIIMEEAGQMLEIETFIPLLLQRGEADGSNAGSPSTRLKRVCLMGDHNQLPPVIQNIAYSKYSNLDQSMFSRLIKIGVPFIQLDRQGRSRPEIAGLYSWRYENLGNLDHVHTAREFASANAGVAFNVQLINVDDFDGKGESSPTPYFFQNVGEAEYTVALFQYMVLIGYPPEKISILTTYNGQKDLISDVLSHRCGEGTPLEGLRPLVVSTVDQYQGQQNDIILLSLVRTRSVGHLRDVRRLIVAVSRARLGLYIFCRQQLFSSCHELKPALDQFRDKPSKLQLVLGESYPTERTSSDAGSSDKLFEVDDVVHMGNLVHKMQQDLVVLTNA